MIARDYRASCRLARARAAPLAAETRPFTVHHRTFAVQACALTLTVSQLAISDAVKAQRRALVGCSRPLMVGCGTVAALEGIPGLPPGTAREERRAGLDVGEEERDGAGW